MIYYPNLKYKKLSISHLNKIPKVNQLIHGIVHLINSGYYEVGDILPSVNQISKIENISRDTVFKAYSELKKRGYIESTPAKGYYVSSNENKIFLFLDSYTPFKDILYNSMVEKLPSGYNIDLGFHHYNIRVFETVILDSIGKYSTYIIMNFNNDKISDVLNKIDRNKLLILDWGKYKEENFSFVCQDFGEMPYKCFKQLTYLFKKYKKLAFVFPPSSVHPMVTWSFFSKYCEEEGIEYTLLDNTREESVTTETAYLVFRQKELIEIMKHCKKKGLTVGEDIGIVAYNDTPLYEIIDNGITVISTDFRLMGKRAAEFALTKQEIFEIIPTRVIIRNSL